MRVVFLDYKKFLFFIFVLTLFSTFVSAESFNYTEDFESYGAGTNPTNWTDYNMTGVNTYVPEDILQVYDNGTNKFLRVNATGNIFFSEYNYTDTYYRWTDGYEVLAKFRRTGDNGNWKVGLIFVSHLANPNNANYYFQIRSTQGTPTFTLNSNEETDHVTDFIDVTDSNTAEDGIFYYMRVNVNNETSTKLRIIAKIWKENETEPSSWGINDTHTLDTGNGYLMNGSVGIIAEDTQIDLDYIEVTGELGKYIPIPNGDGATNFTDSLMVYYKFDDNIINKTADSVGNIDGVTSFDGVSNPIKESEGFVGNSFEFDGLNDYIKSNFTYNWAGQNVFSIAMWVRPNSTQATFSPNALFERETNKVMFLYSAQASAGNEFGTQTGDVASWDANCDSGVDITDGEWRQIFVIYDKTQTLTRLYVNGSSVLNCTNTNGWLQTGEFFFLAQRLTDTGRYTGNIDEVAMWNRNFTDDEVLEYFNLQKGGNGSLYAENVTPPQASPVVAITSPTNNTRDNNATPRIQYTATDDDNTTIECVLYINGVSNQTNSSVINNTIPFFDVSFTDGFFNYNVVCNDTENTGDSGFNYYDLDTSEPFIQSGSPSTFNDTIFTSYTMNIVGNVTDNNLFRINRTIFYPNGTVYYNNYSGNLSVNTSLYSWDDSFNTTELPNGIYSMFIDGADSHTKNKFKEANNVIKDNGNKKLRYEMDFDNIEIALVGGNKLGQFESVDTEKFEDRYNFIFNFKNESQPNAELIFKLTSNLPIVYLEDSLYLGHFILADKYWVDFEGVDGDFEFLKIDNYNYQITLSTGKNQQNFKFESLGGLNEGNLSIEFQINNCVPDWSCTDFGSCNASDLQSCNETIDLNTCGLPYTGDFSEFGNFNCNFCVGVFVEVSESLCVDGLQEVCINDTNWNSCCNVTKGIGDIFGDDCHPLENGSQYFCYNSTCSIFQYDSDDLAPAIIDFIVTFLLALASFVVFIVILLIIFNPNIRIYEFLGFKRKK